MASNPTRTSSIRRAITPSTNMSCEAKPSDVGGISVAQGTTPCVGLIEATPQQ